MEEKKKLLWFTAPWCRPCKNMAPVIDELQDDLPGLVVEKIDVEEQPLLAEQFAVRGLPTFIVVGTEHRVTGQLSKEKLLALLK